MRNVIDGIFPQFKSRLDPEKLVPATDRELLEHRISAVLRAVKHGGMSVDGGTKELLQVCTEREDDVFCAVKVAILQVANELDMDRGRR